MNRFDTAVPMSLLLQREKEVYIFLWTEGRQRDVRRMARKWAKETELNFTRQDYQTICALSRSSE